MNSVLEAVGLSKVYGRKKALSGCDLAIPAGHVVGLVGPNGAGKTTLLHLAVGLLRPTAGSLQVLGTPPGSSEEALARVGFVAQQTPVYDRLSVADHLRLGAWLNSNWDDSGARERVRRIGLDYGQKAGTLSGGQRAQLALTMAVAKRPDLLVLDEPVAALDPLARRDFLGELMSVVAETGIDVILSSHLVGDIERVCDWLVVLVDSRVRLAGEIDDLLASHRRLVGPRQSGRLPTDLEVVTASHTDVQSSFVVRGRGGLSFPPLTSDEIGLEDLVLAYMAEGETPTGDRRPDLEVIA